MNGVNQQLLAYVTEKTRAGVPANYIKRVLLENEWSEDAINEVFGQLNLDTQGVVSDTGTENVPDEETYVAQNSFAREHLAMDKIIEKIIPIAGALFLIVGFGYLLYANAWVHLPMEIRLGLGFFFSITIIGGSFSFAEKMRYFADVGIGSGILLLYGTLVYGSRATELASAMIPEVVTLITAVLFTVVVSYFASKRNSKVILMLGMIGAYITPFVIGQNDIWVENVSFNAYLIYFFAVNVSVFLIGREISVRDMIPLNILGLFIGVSTLWGLASSNNVNAIQTGNFFSGEMFTAILFFVLTVFSMWSILLSAQKFQENDDGYLSLGYIAPIIWFAFNINNLSSLTDATIGTLYVLIAFSCFAGWHVLHGDQTKLQHTALYATGLISSFLALFSFFEEFDVYSSMLITYSSLIFASVYLMGEKKSERFFSFVLVSLTGAVLSIYHILEVNLPYETVLIVVSLLPAISAHFIAKLGGNEKLMPLATGYSIVASIVAALFSLAEILDFIDVSFVMFYLIPLSVLTYLAILQKSTPDNMTHNAKSNILRASLFWFLIGFVTVFFDLVFTSMTWSPA